jgi:hypothetical protein
VAGGDYSRVDPATGKYILIPIPETENSAKFYKYKDIRVTPNYLSDIDADDLEDLIFKLGMNKQARNSAIGYAHFDPWLGPYPWLEKDDKDNHKIGAFGQQGIALRHLIKQEVATEQGVTNGSLFLFYSRFKPFSNVKENPKAREQPAVNIDSQGAYFIYGWLKVGSIIDTRDRLDPDVKALLENKHPHYHNLIPGEDEIFLGAEFLDEDKKIRGFGYFHELAPKFMLSKPDDKTRIHPATKPTIWELPGFFYRNDEHKNERLTYLKDKIWVKNEDSDKANMTELKGYGQEFVFDTSKDVKGLESWLMNMFSNNA